ncbi:hypothetical protein INT48_000224 [Thamnidium elegans]|uniref:CCHC-type domain-containing protein n=1 Tax=Thamnidium elegans TaxID=101142 RepID=A0A8H7VXG8_9FUNG|nr:hypothetical protein INT48_000224 [Thamnidium elegans]
MSPINTIKTSEITLPVNAVTHKCCSCGSFSHKTRECPKLPH